jgi:hypothetical protein
VAVSSTEVITEHVPSPYGVRTSLFRGELDRLYVRQLWARRGRYVPPRRREREDTTTDLPIAKSDSSRWLTPPGTHLTAEDAAHKMLCAMRWPVTDCTPVCPNCCCAAVYSYQCKACATGSSRQPAEPRSPIGSCRVKAP